MKIGLSKLTISVLINVALIICLLLTTLNTCVHDHYYRDFTGMVIHSTRDNILKGNTESTLSILEEIPWYPEYHDLTNALRRFSEMNEKQPSHPDTPPE